MDIPIEDSVQFMNLPLSAQALFFHLLIRAEWDGMQYRIRKDYAGDTRRLIKAKSADVRVLLDNELILEQDGYIYLENVAIYPGPVVRDNQEREVSLIWPGTRLEYSRQRVSDYRRKSVFDFEES